MPQTSLSSLWLEHLCFYIKDHCIWTFSQAFSLVIRFWHFSLFYKQEVNEIFGNILDVYEFSVKLLSSIEDMIELNEVEPVPLIGSSLEETAEVRRG